MFNLHANKKILSGSLLAAGVLTFSLFIKASGYLAPGPLSDINKSGDALGGFMTHADFQKECTHCHGAIHCVIDTHCQDCHQEVAKQRAEKVGIHGRLPGVRQCQNCHTEHQGEDASISYFAFLHVDHENLTGFSLEKHTEDYAGEPLNCESCHSQESYASETLDCLTCHSEHDHDGMAEHIELYGLECLDCHDGKDRMRGFDHQAVYPLEGAHADADCEGCHAEYVFAGTAEDCVSCHENPDVHNSGFGVECQRCHTAEAWAPAFLREHVFLLDHGEGNPKDCALCHPVAYTEHDCYACHDHTEAGIVQSHVPEGILEYEDCISCHPTGVSGEARLLQGSSPFQR